MHNACMNKQIHVRDFDSAAHARLVEQANAKGLSLSEFVRQELTAIAQQKLSLQEFYKHLKTRKGIHLDPSAEQTIREDRDSRS